MKLLLTGLPGDATADKVKVGMEKLGPVSHVEIVDKGNDAVWAIVEMAITDDQAFRITRQITDIWHDGKFVNITIMNH
ncbi:MAG: hypothetical protein RIQ55_780 [Pseudomonadota bacterium]